MPVTLLQKEDATLHVEEGATHPGLPAINNAIDTAIETGNTGIDFFNARAWMDSTISADQDLDVLQKQWTRIFPNDSNSSGVRCQSRLTLFEILSTSKHTSELMKLVKEYPDLVSTLKDSMTNHTIWAPTDAAFSKCSDILLHASDLRLKEIMQHHITPHFMPMRRILVTPNIPVLLSPWAPHLHDKYRLRLRPSLTGMTVNFDACMIVGDIFACNGVIHVVDAVVLPPPSIMEVIQSLPSAHFSMLQLAFKKCRLAEKLDHTRLMRSTLFAPSNEAFRKLGEELNTFLASEEGEGHLQALLQYHIAPNQTLFSNAFYNGPDPYPVPPSPSVSSSYYFTGESIPHSHRLIKGRRCFHLSTMLFGQDISVDVARYGGLITMRVNDSATVTTQDRIACNGVVHEIDNVLVPPSTPGATKVESVEEFQVRDFKARMADYL
ncbi:hypothetical protein MMC11_008710 [Xylographa trunciseda]|nr:hypothetical protein [Xylographa trunciseda]